MSLQTWCLLQLDRLRREGEIRIWTYRRLLVVAEREDRKARLFLQVAQTSPYWEHEDA